MSKHDPDAPRVHISLGREIGHSAAETFPWLWEPYLAFGTLAVIDGDPGSGKSLITLDLAARFGTGRPLPDGSPPARHPDQGNQPVRTLFVNAEDGVRQTILPRLLAAGGDPATVAFMGGLGEGGPRSLPVLFPDDLPVLARLLRTGPATFVVLDPLIALLPRDVGANNDQAVRSILTPLARLAAETSSCILMVRHLNKSAGRRSLYRGSGSIGIVGACRTGLMVSRHPDDPDRRVLAMTKSNTGPAGDSLGFRVQFAESRRVDWPLPAGERHPLTGEVAAEPTTYSRLIPAGPVVAWDGPTPLSADELCSAKPDFAGQAGRAAAWLRRVLADGPVAATTIEALAHAEGIGYRTICLAKARLKVDSQRVMVDGRARWEWMLPPRDGLF